LAPFLTTQQEQGDQLRLRGDQLRLRGDQLMRIERRLGVITETEARKYAEKQFGEAYGKSP
jgi:hypothetical protein